MKPAILLIAAALAGAAPQNSDLYTPNDIQAMKQALAAKHEKFASKNLQHYGNHYTMLAYREGTGSAEVHQHEADIFIVESGSGTIVLGGKVVQPKMEKPGEIRGTSIEGGEKRAIGSGDILHIAAGVPHQLLIEPGNPFTYFVVKVTGQ